VQQYFHRIPKSAFRQRLSARTANSGFARSVNEKEPVITGSDEFEAIIRGRIIGADVVAFGFHMLQLINVF